MIRQSLNFMLGINALLLVVAAISIAAMFTRSGGELLTARKIAEELPAGTGT